MRPAADRPELIARLQAGIARLTTSAEWQRYLDSQARFHHYSFGNVLLITSQFPDATRVAGFRTWAKMGRSVRKGERAIFILAPMVHRPVGRDPDDPRRVVRGFKWVGVFDVSQTEGEDLPSVVNQLVGDDPDGLFDRLVRVAESIGFSVVQASLPGSTNGDCSPHTKTIRVEIANTPAQRVKTLAHEIAHAMLHAHCRDRKLAELEAESVAWLVCQVVGLDTSGYSFAYVATWAGGGDQAVAGISSSCERIQKAADTILGELRSPPIPGAMRTVG